MPEPIILSTWSFGRKANAAGWPYLAGPKASSLDAVEQACRAIEADKQVHSVGCGGCPDRSGEVTLDASIMVSPARCGSVCYVRQFPHPVSVARLVMEKLRPVVMLSGEGADRFAIRQGLAPANLLTERAQAMWRKWIARHPAAQCHDETAFPPPAEHGRVGRLAGGRGGSRTTSTTTRSACWPSTRAGQMAGACSTSGLPFKVPGRVGDSPIIGHGLYVDPRRGAAVATGVGELVMGVCGSFLAVELMGRGSPPKARRPRSPPADPRQLPDPRKTPGGDHRHAPFGAMERRRAAAGLLHGGPHRHPRRTGPARVRAAAVENARSSSRGRRRRMIARIAAGMLETRAVRVLRSSREFVAIIRHDRRRRAPHLGFFWSHASSFFGSPSTAAFTSLSLSLRGRPARRLRP